VQDLLSINDPDWAAFQAQDPEYLMRTAGVAIRTYCGWHIAPSETMTIPNIEVGSRGLMMLPSLHVTAVQSVMLQSTTLEPPVVVDPMNYTWHEEGYIEPVAGAQWYSGWYAGYYYEPGPYYLPQTNFGLVTVTFTHGYSALPEDIKQVAYETILASGGGSEDGSVGTLPSSTSIKEIASPGFRLVLNAGGANGESGTGTVGSLTENQKNRLAPYRIPGVK
jgi:hypothetical protein